MPYSLTLPNGFVVNDIPDNIPRDQAMGMLEEKMPDAFPGIGEQLLRSPLEVGKGFVRGLTVDPASGIASLGYTGARAAGATEALYLHTDGRAEPWEAVRIVLFAHARSPAAPPFLWALVSR